MASHTWQCLAGGRNSGTHNAPLLARGPHGGLGARQPAAASCAPAHGPARARGLWRSGQPLCPFPPMTFLPICAPGAATAALRSPRSPATTLPLAQYPQISPRPTALPRSPLSPAQPQAPTNPHASACHHNSLFTLPLPQSLCHKWRLCCVVMCCLLLVLPVTHMLCPPHGLPPHHFQH